MDKLNKYQKILIDYLRDYAKNKPVNLPDIDVQVEQIKGKQTIVLNIRF